MNGFRPTLSGKKLAEATADVRRRLETGQLTAEAIAVLTSEYQGRVTEGYLVRDGKPGPKTVQSLSEIAIRYRRVMPLPSIPHPTAGLRLPQITSGFQSADRPKHNGVDLFYRYSPQLDPPMAVGDGGATRGPDGSPKWFIPPGTKAIAAEDGVVTRASRISTGIRIAIRHFYDGSESIYCHLTSMDVKKGDVVEAGQPLGLVGDNPADIDAIHLHFEVSSTWEAYRPIDPKQWLKFANFVQL